MIALLFAGAVGFGGSPKDTIETFVRAFNARDARTLVQQVVGGRAGIIPPEFGEAKLRVAVRGIVVAGDRATVRARSGTSDQDGNFEWANETILLRRTGRDWRIVPADPLAPTGRPPAKPRFVAYTAFVVIHSPRQPAQTAP